MERKQSTARELIAFSLPLILSGILQQLYSWADAPLPLPRAPRGR